MTLPSDAPNLEVGVVVGAHGVAGALRVRLHNQDSTSLASKVAVALRGPAEREVRGEVRRVVAHPGTSTVRVWLAGVENRDQAEALRGYQVFVPRDSTPLEDDEYFLADLVGLEVVGEPASPMGANTSLGRVTGIGSNGAQDLLEIEWEAPNGQRHEWMLPVLPEFVRSFDQAGVRVNVPAGFLPPEFES